MRRLAVVVVLSGCFGQLDSNMRPAVQPKLSELGEEAGKRDAILNQAGTTPGPELPRQQLKGKWRTIETGAAFAAALLGVAASKTSNVTLGIAVTIDPVDDAPKPTPPPAPPASTSQLLPWIPLPAPPP